MILLCNSYPAPCLGRRSRTTFLYHIIPPTAVEAHLCNLTPRSPSRLSSFQCIDQKALCKPSAYNLKSALCRCKWSVFYISANTLQPPLGGISKLPVPRDTTVSGALCLRLSFFYYTKLFSIRFHELLFQSRLPSQPIDAKHLRPT